MGSVVYFAVFLIGIALGLAYFGGLWWTVTAVSRHQQSAWSLAVSFVVRITLLMVGLYVVLLAGVWHLIACLAGVLIARALLLRVAARNAAELASRS